MKTPPFLSLRKLSAAVVVIASACAASVFAQTNGNWAADSAGNWSDATKWSSNPAIPGGATSTVGLTFNITNNRIITIDTTSRTVGLLNIGDTNASHNYTLAASGGASLIFDNSGAGAILNNVATAGSSTSVSAPVILADHLNLTNSSATGLITLSGGITGAKNLALNANAGGGITLSTGSVNNGGSITNSGSGAGITTISGIIGTNITGVVQDSATSQLVLSGANLFSTGVTIKKGTLVAGNNAAALGTGTVLLGDTSGSNDATLSIANGLTYANSITVQAGSSSNTLAITAGALNKAVLSGGITLNNNLTLNLTAPGGAGGVSTTSTLPYLTVSGAIGGTGNLTLNASGLGITSNAGGQPVASAYTISGAITTTGSLTDASTGQIWKTISGDISGISSLNMNGANSTLILSGTNTYTGPTNVNAGVLRITGASALQNTPVTVASGGTLQLTNVTVGSGQTLTLTGQGTSFTAGALDTTNNGTYAGSIILAADATVADSLATTTLTLSGGITGAGKTLTVGGVGNTTISGAIATTTGGLTKTGTGLLTLSSASNSYTGTTRISSGILSLTNASALGGGGNITFDGGTLRHNSTNEVDYGSRIVNSTGPISIDTNARNVTYATSIAASNSGGLTKLGTGSLTLSGTNTYSGITAINAGTLAYTAAGAISAGGVLADAGGALNSGGAYANVQAWLDSGAISTASTGAIALTANSSENINFSTGGYTNLMLGATATTTYSGTITPAGSLYRLGGGGSALTLSGTNVLTGGNGLVVGAKSGLGVSTGSVTISGSNDLSGATTVNVGTLTLSGIGTLGTSGVTVNPTATLAITSNTAATPVTRASSLTLSNGTLTVTGNATADSTDTITNALTIASGGNSTVTITPNASQNALLTFGSYVHNAGGTVLFRGTNLGVNSLASVTNGAANISISTPNLVGAGGTGTDRSILVGAIGDITAAGTGFGTNGGLLTYETTNGLRLLSAGEYKTTIDDAQTQLDNVRLTSTAGTTVTTTLNSNTTINSLSLGLSTTNNSIVSVTGTGTLTLNSGVIYANSTAQAVGTTGAMIVNNTLDLNGREGIVFVSTSGISEGIGGGQLRLDGIISNSGGNGLTIHGTTNSGVVTLGGTASNTYTGTTTISGANVILNKTAGLNAITGDLVVNRNGVVFLNVANQIADTANVTVNGGTFYTVTKNSGTGVAETINNLTINNAGIAYAGSTLTINGDATVSGGGLLRTWDSGSKIVIGGALNLSDGGTLRLLRSQSPTGGGVFENIVTLNGGLNITNQTSGAYTPITIDFGTGNVQKGGQLVLNGDVTFTGNSTNTNTTTIDGPRGSGTQGVIALTGNTSGARTFNVGNGTAAVDLTVTAPLTDGSAGASGLTKTGLGTLALSGSSTYTGDTTVTTGTLLVNNVMGSGLGTGNAVVNGGKLGGSGAFTGTLTVNSSATLAPGASIESLASGALAFTTGSTFGYEMDFGAATSVGADLQVVTGNLSLTGTVTLTLANLTAGTFANNTKFTLINYSGTWNNGLFTYLGNSLADNSTFSFNGQDWQIDYNASSGGSNFSSEQLGANFVTMTAVPEPATWALLAFSLTTVMVLRRRRS